MEQHTRLRRRRVKESAETVKPLYFLPLRVDADPSSSSTPTTLTLTLAGLRPRDTIHTVKELIEYKYGIPYAHQSLRGPVPSERELTDAQSLRRQGVVLGRIVLPGASQMSPEYSNSAEELTAEAAGSARESASGILFSTSQAHLLYPAQSRIPLGEDSSGSAGLGTAVDVVRLHTFRPLADYAEGGAYYTSQQRYRRCRHVLAFIATMLVLAVMFYVWWMVPYYKMPLPQAWMGRYEADIKRTALYTRLRDEGMDPAQLSLPADPRGRAVDARAAATLARLAAGEL